MTQDLKIKVYFMPNIMELDMRKLLNSEAVTSAVWDLKTSLGNLGQKDVSSHKSGNLALIFTTKTSFSTES